MTLKLLALDDEDLTVISAHMQDAVFRVADVEYMPKHKHLTIAANLMNSIGGKVDLTRTGFGQGSALDRHRPSGQGQGAQPARRAF